MNRRQFLHALAAGSAWVTAQLVAPRRGWALGQASKVALAQVLYTGGNPQPRPTGLRRLAWELEKRTSIDVDLEPKVVRLSDRLLYRYPFLYLGGDSEFPAPPPTQLERLRRHLVFGGFLLVDSADARPGAGFDRSVRSLVAALFPRRPLQKLDKKNTLFKSFYLLHEPVGRVSTVPDLEGVVSDGRVVLLYCQNDLAGAWSRDNFGQWEFSVYPGGSRQRELAIRWGINIVTYSLCIDYKADQVHVPFILKRRPWRTP